MLQTDGSSPAEHWPIDRSESGRNWSYSFYRFESWILANVPGLNAYQEGRDVMLSFDHDIGHVISGACLDVVDGLSKAAHIIRRQASLSLAQLLEYNIYVRRVNWVTPQ